MAGATRHALMLEYCNINQDLGLPGGTSGLGHLRHDVSQWAHVLTAQGAQYGGSSGADGMLSPLREAVDMHAPSTTVLAV